MERGGGMVTPGFRFYPTEEELISFYLKRKIEEDNSSSRLQQIDCVIPQLRVYDFYPWDLPQYAGELCHGDPEQWFFFIPRQEKEARGGRPCRLTSSGYWKATGSPSIVYSSSNRRIGVKRTMVFYCGRAPNGKKTKWKMNEYKAFQEEASSSTNPKPKLMDELSLCRVYVKSTCLRAFDRRPSGVALSKPNTVQQTLRNEDHHATASSRLDCPLMTQTTTTSSYDHNKDSPEDQTTNNFHDTTDNQPLRNWEELHHGFQN